MVELCPPELREHYRDLIDQMGGVPGSLSVTVRKLNAAPTTEGRHSHGHHVGSWSFSLFRSA